MTAIIQQSAIDKIQELLITGNIAQFSPVERVQYIKSVCESLGLNPLTRPIEFITLNGRLVPYAKKDCTDQLRKIHGVSIRVTKQEIIEGLLFVTVEATDKTGRVDSDVGVLNISGLKGDALANASMKALTKAKRRVTLSICGLGILDETEIETIPGAPHVDQSAFSDMTPNEETFKDIRSLLVTKGKNEDGLIKYINTQFKSEFKSIEEMGPAHVNYAYRALGVNK